MASSGLPVVVWRPEIAQAFDAEIGRSASGRARHRLAAAFRSAGLGRWLRVIGPPGARFGHISAIWRGVSRRPRRARSASVRQLRPSLSPIIRPQTRESAGVQRSGVNGFLAGHRGAWPPEEAVPPGAVGGERRPRPGGQVGEAAFGQPAQPEDAHEAVGGEGPRPQNLRQPPGAQAALELHLPQPVLGVNEAEGEIGVAVGARADAHHAVAVAGDLDRRGEPRQHHHAPGLGQRGAEPGIAARRRREADGEDAEDAARKPPSHGTLRRHARPWIPYSPFSRRAASSAP